MRPQSLWDVLQFFITDLRNHYSEKKATEISGQTLTALTRYTLPGMGHPIIKGRKPTQAEMRAAEQFMDTIPLKRLPELLTLQESVFEMLQTPSASQYTYRSRLNTLLTWAKTQIWFPATVEKLSKNFAPRKKHGYGNTKGKVVTTRRLLEPYAIRNSEMNTTLKNELDEFARFFTAENYPGRKFSPVKPRTIESHTQGVRMALGWLYRSQQVPLEELSFDALIPKVPLRHCKDLSEALRHAEDVAETVDERLCLYLEFLKEQRGYQSSSSLIQALIAIHALTRFQYRRETRDSKYNDIPVMQVLREHLRRLGKQSWQDKSVADSELKWLDLPNVWENIVAVLRHECAYRGCDGTRRSISAIAQSFQIFLAWGLLTFRPPRRQQEFRELKISLSCPIQRPKGIIDGTLIHPLPVDRDKDKYSGYLYKDADGTWYEDKTPESYKTGKTYGHQSLPVPNPVFADGKYFYDYLEAFLYGYYREPDGYWRSGGELAETPSWKGQWCSLRMAFNPVDNHVFVKPTNGKPHSTSSFYRIIQNSAHRLTGQMVTPHLLRDIYATWFLDQGYTEDRIHSLAYAMAHSIEVLRKIYDRRRPQQKVRPIQEVVSDLLTKYIS